MNKKFKIYFELENGETESLWAEKINDKTYRLLNSPFYFYGISYLDLFEVKENNNLLYFKSIKEKSNHSTYRIILNAGITKDSNTFFKIWSKLEKIGCTYENADNKLFAIDVPKSTDINKAYELLEFGELNNIWDFEEGDYGYNN